LIDILDSLARIPAYEAISMGHPERMGIAYGWDEATFIAQSKTLTPQGTTYRNLCIGCDRFHEQVLRPVIEAARLRRQSARAVARIVAEKAAGRDSDGGVDLVWINGANFLALKQHSLLYGPFAERLPNYRYVDTTHVLSNVVDFTVPVDGYEVPWRRAQIVFV